MFEDTASALFGVEGLQVTDVQAGPGGVVEVWAVTDWPGAAACPDCGTASSKVHERVPERAQHEDIPELASLAATISRWEDQIVTAVITGVTNATSESLNRLAKLEARLANGFRHPANQRRRVRIACTRGTRRASPAATRNRARPVTATQPRPR